MLGLQGTVRPSAPHCRALEQNLGSHPDLWDPTPPVFLGECVLLDLRGAVLCSSDEEVRSWPTDKLLWRPKRAGKPLLSYCRKQQVGFRWAMESSAPGPVPLSLLLNPRIK